MIASYVLLITMGTTLLATAVTCLPLCCRSAQQDVVQLDTKVIKEHQQPNDQLAVLNVPNIEDLQERSTPPSRVGKYNILDRPNHETHHDLSDSRESPSFQDVVVVGSKYQKF